MSMLVKFRQCHFIIPPDTNAIFRRVERVVASLSLLGLELLGTMVERDCGAIAHAVFCIRREAFPVGPSSSQAGDCCISQKSGL